jgi:hypothetical protein
MSDKTNKVQLFENRRVRSAWDEDNERWLFSIVDVVGILTDQPTQRNSTLYWGKLKQRLKSEGSELLTNCQQLKMTASDGKKRLTDVADTERLLRVIQSIPSPKAEPFKAWLARVGSERIDETVDPELAIDRALGTYLKKGYSPDWIHERLLSIRVRKELTDEWKARDMRPGQEYAILTDDVVKSWSGFKTREYKNHKGLKKENLRDNMSSLELALNSLAEATTTEISKAVKPVTFDENREVARRGGGIAGNARREIETATGKPVVTSKNALDFARLLNGVIEGSSEKDE